MITLNVCVEVWPIDYPNQCEKEIGLKSSSNVDVYVKSIDFKNDGRTVASMTSPIGLCTPFLLLLRSNIATPSHIHALHKCAISLSVMCVAMLERKSN